MQIVVTKNVKAIGEIFLVFFQLSITLGFACHSRLAIDNIFAIDNFAIDNYRQIPIGHKSYKQYKKTLRNLTDCFTFLVTIFAYCSYSFMQVLRVLHQNFLNLLACSRRVTQYHQLCTLREEATKRQTSGLRQLDIKTLSGVFIERKTKITGAQNLTCSSCKRKNQPAQSKNTKQMHLTLWTKGPKLVTNSFQSLIDCTNSEGKHSSDRHSC